MSATEDKGNAVISVIEAFQQLYVAEHFSCKGGCGIYTTKNLKKDQITVAEKMFQLRIMYYF